MPDLPFYDLFAIRYATRAGRRSDHFIGGDPHDGPMPMDYFVWAAVSAAGAYVIDTGFTAETAARRGRTFLRCPVESLRLVGVDPDAVGHVILTHMHYDHVGNFHRFPRARFHLQEPELRYATGRYMNHARLRHSFEVEDVVGVVRLTYADRVSFYNGPAELAPGVTLHPAPGHSMGLQFVRVHTRRGWVVVASDVTHFYENMESRRPFTTAVNVADMLEAFGALLAHAPAKDHIVPGHDPLVMARYPAVSPALAGIAVRLDVSPHAATQLATGAACATRTGDIP
jgi:glyoxylase-like metal-dependent hydrolase (beta-lactamase superfamily II)